VKCIIDRQVVLSRAPEGPLVSHIGPFARSPSEQRYTLGSIQQSTSRLSEQPVEGTRRSEESQHMNTRLPKVLATSFVMLTLLGAAVSARAQAPPKYALQRTRKPHKRHRKTRSPGKVNDTEDQFDPDSINLLLRDLQTGWLRRFDEAK
jgi:hypothetical protein